MYARKLARLNVKLSGKWDLIEANWKMEEAVLVVEIKRHPNGEEISGDLLESDSVRITIPYAEKTQVGDVKIDLELLMKTGFMVYMEVGIVGFTTSRNQMIKIHVHAEKTSEIAFLLRGV